MRLLYISDSLAIYGGLERVLIDKANWLVRHGGYEVYVLTVSQGNHPICFPLHSEVKYDDLDICYYQLYRLPFWKRPYKKYQLYRLFLKRLRGKIQEIAPDIIVSMRLDYVPDLVRMKGHIPLVFESHSSCLASRFEGDGILRRIYVSYLQRAVKNAEMTVSLTQGDAEEWRKLTSNVCIIPNVVHLNESGSYSACTAKSVIFVGRFSKQKDVGSLLHIWMHVHQCYPDWCLHIYGGYGEEKDSFISVINKMDANIQVHEATSEIFEKYTKSSMLLLTSCYEPFGLVIPEAMSCGLPVVAFDCPYGPADIIQDGIDGFLIHNRDFDAFTKKIGMLIDNFDLRVKMGKVGIESSKRYDESRIMPLWIQLFERLVK